MEGCPYNSEIITVSSPITDEEKWLLQEAYGVVYKITNTLNGKIYIGQHFCKGNTAAKIHSYFGSGGKIKRAIKEYGKENFTKEYIAIATSRQELDELEIHYIAYYNSRDESIGYNVSKGGFVSFEGGKHSEETLKKLSEHSKQVWQDPLLREKIIQGRMSHIVTDETKKKISESAKKSWTDERRRQAHESGNYVKKLTPEQVQKIKERNTGRIRIHNGVQERMVKPEELNDYIENGWVYGKLNKATEETRRKMSEAAKNRKPTTLGRICIHLENKTKFVMPEELDTYISKGWTKGPIKRPFKPSLQKGFKTLVKDGKRKMVSPTEVENYLKDGWAYVSTQSITKP